MKPLLVVVVVAAILFRVAKPLALKFTTEEVFLRRRNVWFFLTIVAFLSPNFWLYAFLAMPVLLWAARKDSNPVGLYLLLLQVIPVVPADIPVSGIGALFSLDHFRLLSFCVLIPAVWRLRKSSDPLRLGAFVLSDLLLLGYGALLVAFFIPPDLPSRVMLQDSLTNAIRRAFLFALDIYLVYFSVSRWCSSRSKLVDAMVSYGLASVIVAVLAFIESARNWLLYVDLAVRWSNDSSFGFYLSRGTWLRAQATAGHPLALGFLVAIAFGFWLYLQNQVTSKSGKSLVTLLLWLGLLAAYSRGPWVGAIVIYASFAALGPRGFSRLMRAAAVLAVVAATVALTPLGEKIITVLPFMGGTVDSGSLGYRQLLTQRSLDLIFASPFFGDHFPWSKMEDLRQGQGIIDLVNTYATIALLHGLVGLALFVGFILVGVSNTYSSARAIASSDADLGTLGVSITASVLGALIMISSNSFGLGIEKVYYILGGMAVAYSNYVQTSLKSRSLPRVLPGGAGNLPKGMRRSTC